MTDGADGSVVLAELFREYNNQQLESMGSPILLLSRYCYRCLTKHLSRSSRLREQVLLVYYQLLQTSPFSVQLLHSQLLHEPMTVDLLLGLTAARNSIVTITLIVI